MLSNDNYSLLDILNNYKFEKKKITQFMIEEKTQLEIIYIQFGVLFSFNFIVNLNKLNYH